MPQYETGWPTDLHPNGGAVPYGHVMPANPMMAPPLLSPGSEAPGHGGMVPQQPMPAVTTNPHAVYDQWMPSAMGVGGRAPGGMGAGMYSSDAYYGAMAPPHSLATNPYAYGYHHVPMYNPYPAAPAAPAAYDPAPAMYNAGPPYLGPPASTAPPSAPPPPANVTPPYSDSVNAAPNTNQVS